MNVKTVDNEFCVTNVRICKLHGVANGFHYELALRINEA